MKHFMICLLILQSVGSIIGESSSIQRCPEMIQVDEIEQDPFDNLVTRSNAAELLSQHEDASQMVIFGRRLGIALLMRYLAFHSWCQSRYCSVRTAITALYKTMI